MKLAFVVGHNAHAQGAVRKDTGETEYSWNSRLAEMIKAEARDFPKIEVAVFKRNPTGRGYAAEIRDVYARTDAWGADATVEGHFNSHSTASATGAEVLSSGSRMSLKFCEAIQEETLAVLGLKDRGTKVVRTGRGAMSLITGKAPAALTEPFFGSSPIGLAATDEDKEMRALARAILRATQRVFLA